MKKSTITDLPNDIKAAVPNWENNSMLRSIISRASIGEFHDFKSVKSVTPKMDLVRLLSQACDNAVKPIIEAVKNGDYDESPDDDDKAALKKILNECDSDGRLRKILSLS